MYIILSFGLLFISLGLAALGAFAIAPVEKITGIMVVIFGTIVFGKVVYCLIKDKLKEKSKQE